MSDIDDARAMTRARREADDRDCDEPETDEEEAERLQWEDEDAEMLNDWDDEYGGDE